jgi:hypothetical protein
MSGPTVLRWTATWSDFLTLRNLQVLVPLVVGGLFVVPWLLQLAGVDLADRGTVGLMQGLGLILLLFGVLVTGRFVRFVTRSVGTEVTWTVTGVELRVQTDRGRDSHYPWASLSDVVDRGRAIEVRVPKGPRLRVPLRAFPNPEAERALIQRMGQSIAEAKRGRAVG